MYENESFLSFVPYAPRFPFEVWIMPKKHQPNYETITKYEITDLASILKTTLCKLALALNNPPYNYMLHTSPTNMNDPEIYHWHLEIIPIITHTAGFEWGTGFYINPTPPEKAACYLRELEEQFDHAAP